MPRLRAQISTSLDGFVAGPGSRLFDDPADAAVRLELAAAVTGRGVTHLTHRVLR